MRVTYWLAVSLGLLLLSSPAACSSSVVAKPQPAVPCGSPAPIVAAQARTGLSPGIWIGSLFLTASWRWFDPGTPTKVVIFAATGPVTLSGYACSDKSPLHFWYDSGPAPFQPPADRSVLASVGLPAVTLSVNHRPGEAHGGYIFFPRSGKYALTAQEVGGPPVTATVLVQQAPA